MDGGEPVPFSQVFVVAKDGDYFHVYVEQTWGR